MIKIRLYQEDIFILNDIFKLNTRNSHYLIKVLRAKINDKIILFNGDNNNYQAKINKINKYVIVEIIQKTKNLLESKLNIILIQAIGKNDKMDLVVQKATELGVKEIIPLISDRVIVNLKNKQQKKLDHWQQIAIASCEQSGRSIVPTINKIITFNELFKQNIQNIFILNPTSLKSLFEYKAVNNCAIIVGPEGGFTDNELKRTIANNYQHLSLGKRILRTETAALVCLANMQLLWGN